MAYALAKENEQFIQRMVKRGRFNNQSEVVREALRRMEREETSYLNPPPLSEEEADRIFAPNPVWDRLELSAVRKSKAAIQRLVRSRKLKLKDM